jgi:hypothetical protein
VIANNLANIGTTGFKRDRADFATLAYQEQRVAGQQSTGQTAFAVGLNLGTGVQLQGTPGSRRRGRSTTPPTRSIWRWMAPATFRSSCRRAVRWASPVRAISPCRTTAR